MNTPIFFRLVLVASTLGMQLCAKDHATYLLKLKFPQTIREMPGLSGCYRGNPLDLQEHWCMLPEAQEVYAFSIVITPEIAYKTTGNNVKYLKRQTGSACRWFDITLHLDKKTGNYSWDVEEKARHDMPMRLPDHAIIIFLNPDFVDTVRTLAADEEERSALNIIVLPVIVLKKNVTAQDLDESSVYPQLALLDLKPILRAKHLI